MVSVANRLNNIGSILRDQGRLDEALQYFQRALEIDERALGPDHPSVAMTKSNFAGVLFERGDKKRAIDMYRTAYESLRKSLGAEHPLSRTVSQNLKAAVARTGL